ncbi:MAG TPA: DUF3575 domain-containing protein [Chitinophagaceae bacterium]|jgi:hypothetical protein|nr:DUF3575 domain-containing protein [Chitinophagaceae bacterium]
MKKTIFPTLLFLFCIYSANAQRKLALKWAPTGLLLGNINAQAEYGFGKHSSINIQFGIPSPRSYSPKFDDKDASISVKTTSFLAGYRIYASHRKMRGFYFEPYFKNVHLTGTGSGSSTLQGQPVVMNFTGDYKGSGVGVQMGTQFVIAKRVVLDFYFIGPEINTSHANFKSIEVTNTIPWNSSQAAEAEQNVRDFLDKIPVVGKKVDLTVDQNNRTITADYKGLLPGFRFGLSIGIML